MKTEQNTPDIGLVPGADNIHDKDGLHAGGWSSILSDPAGEGVRAVVPLPPSGAKQSA